MNTAKALLGYALEIRLASRTTREPVQPDSPWDLWWACYRAGLSAADLLPQARTNPSACRTCSQAAWRLAKASPPRHPGLTRQEPCGCLTRWAIAMRQPGEHLPWPPVSLSLALIKPGAPAARVTEWLRSSYTVISARSVLLTVADARSLYPEAYGADFVHDRDKYLTSGTSQVLILRAEPGAPPAPALIKAGIRGRLSSDELRNHLHMPDNPGETFADIALFAGYPMLAELYRRYESGDTAGRLAFYRSALGIGEASAYRAAAAG